jgi:EAL domain-containing protein (putative c-di-GMP-specific phosphodiesterase class I)
VDRSIADEIDRHRSRLIPAALLVAFAEVAAGVAAGEPALLGAAALSAGFGLMILLTGLLTRFGHPEAVAPVVASSVYVLGLAGAILIPGGTQVSAMLPILSVVLLVPGRRPRTAVGLIALAVSGSVVALAISDLPHVFPPMREPLASLFHGGTLLGVTVLILFALVDFAVAAKSSTDGLRRAMRTQADTFAERTAIVASLGRLEPRESPQLTAAMIVDELGKLPLIHLAAVFACTESEIEVLAMTGPPGFPVREGDRLPPARARHLLDRMADGPWAERWTGDPAFGSAYAEAVTATGIQGQAFAPFHDGGRIIGAVAIGTQSSTHADHLVTDLPAVAEFAATASVLLAPMLRDRAAIQAERQAIQAILEAGAHRPVFQPVVELETGRTVGFEALTRFDDGRRPDLVFAEASHAGIGFELELRTLESALVAAVALPAGTWLSLNVSPALLVGAPTLAGVLVRRDRPIVLEVTEHVPIDDYRAVRSAIDRQGPDVRIAVDDAGAGIANFSHLVELRPRIVKVDAGLVRELDTDLARQAVVAGFVHFAAKAGCEVIAEGIETEAERATALALGVTHGQGYLFARPAPAETFTDAALQAEVRAVATTPTADRRAVVPFRRLRTAPSGRRGRA